MAILLLTQPRLSLLHASLHDPLITLLDQLLHIEEVPRARLRPHPFLVSLFLCSRHPVGWISGFARQKGLAWVLIMRVSVRLGLESRTGICSCHVKSGLHFIRQFDIQSIFQHAQKVTVVNLKLLDLFVEFICGGFDGFTDFGNKFL